jgi:hypothetical protein
MNDLRCLPLFQVDQQKKLRGAANSSNTNVVTTGFVDTLFKLLFLVCETFMARKPQQVDSDLDQLEPHKLAKAIYDRLVAHPDLEPPTTDAAQMRERMEALRTIRSGRPTRLVRDVEAVA